MARIRVDPAILRQASQVTSGIGATLSQVGGSVLGKVSSAPSYDGQFGPRVQAIGSEALARAQGVSTRMNDLSGRLQRRAQAFEAADMSTSMAGLGNLNIGLKNWLEISRLLTEWRRSAGAPYSSLLRYLLLGTLLRGIGVNLPLGVLISMAVRSRYFWNGQTFKEPEKIKPTENLDKSFESLTWKQRYQKLDELDKEINRLDQSPRSEDKAQHEKLVKERDILSSVIDREKPKPVKNLNDSVKPEIKGSCAIYAQNRRPDLGPTGASPGANQDEGAYNYKFKNGAFQLSTTNEDTSDLRGVIAKGYVIVWDKTTPGANPTYGHVAIVEEVHSDYILVSHSGWPSGTRTKFPREYIDSRQLYIVP